MCAVGLEGYRRLRVAATKQTIDSTKYYSRLAKLNEAIDRKGSELANKKDIVLHHDNARGYTFMKTRFFDEEKIVTICLERFNASAV